MRRRKPNCWLPTIVAVGLAAFPFLASAAEPAPEAPPKIEYVEVEGQTCLQPRLRTVPVELADYQDAARRWLKKKYPGSFVSNWQTILQLAPDAGTDAAPEDVTVQQETAYVTKADGSKLAVCFDINVKRRADKHDV